jgi:short subunit dehydrogenase-like uncharacterized protein
MSMAADRMYDLVLFGATGFTGALAAEYLAAAAPAGCRWALAGRNLTKLAALRDRLAARHPAMAEVPMLLADVTDPQSLAEVAANTRVVATTVGPYVSYGEPLVAACAEHGTDYVDLTGESEFVDLMYVRHHDRAVRNGARIVHACGFDSIPYDLGVLFTVRQLPAGVPIAVDGLLRASASFSGGTAASALTAFGRRGAIRAAGQARRGAELRPVGRRISTRAKGVHRAPGGLGWAVALPTVDPQIVGRSAAALERYGPSFSYRHYLVVRRLPMLLGGLAATSAVFLLAQLAPARRWLQSRRKPGDGPTAEQRARSWFSVRFVGVAGAGHADAVRVVTQVSGGDPGYDETAKMLSEAALCLAFDDLPPTSGQVTTAVAMGDALIDRLIKAGMRFEVLEQA